MKKMLCGLDLQLKDLSFFLSIFQLSKRQDQIRRTIHEQRRKFTSVFPIDLYLPVIPVFTSKAQIPNFSPE
ncbi:hypothetical protein V513_12680 [Mesotoga sp. H07.pep.5.3]|nr:hypothetical protein V513_12680 [Mesotoga sp. H07.pep.5.3]